MPTYKLITSTEITTNTGSVTLSSIPATYNDLVLKIVGRSDNASGTEYPFIRFNSDSSSVYSEAYLIGSSSISRNGNNMVSGFYPPVLNSNNATSNSFGIIEMYINQYSKTNAEKPYVAHGTQGTNSSITYFGGFSVGNYYVYTAISSITLTPFNGSNWLPGTSFWLYGIKNS